MGEPNGNAGSGNGAAAPRRSKKRKPPRKPSSEVEAAVIRALMKDRGMSLMDAIRAVAKRPGK